MDQRSNLIHPTLRHPKTGEPLLALGEIGGKVIWPVLGASPEDGSNSGDAGENHSEGTESTEGGENNSEGEENNSKGTETVTKEEYDRIHARMTAADRRSSDLLNKIKAFEDKDKSELEKAQGDLAEATKDRDASKQALQSLRVEVEFLKVDGISWHNKGDALKMLLSDYMDGVEIDDQGKVKGVDAAAKRMAKDKAYLVNSTPATSTGDKMNGSRKGDASKQSQSARDESLRKRFPSLGRV